MKFEKLKYKAKIKKLDDIVRINLKRKYDYCYTCGGNYNLQVGHYLSRRFIYIRWNEDNLRMQCENCNVFLNGNIEHYKFLLTNEIGKDKLMNLEIVKNIIPDFDFLTNEYERLKNET